MKEDTQVIISMTQDAEPLDGGNFKIEFTFYRDIMYFYHVRIIEHFYLQGCFVTLYCEKLE